jgi:hypothetical protein
MTSDIEDSTSDFKGTTQAADFSFALDQAFAARIAVRQRKPRRAGADDQELVLSHRRTGRDEGRHASAFADSPRNGPSCPS